MFTNHLKVCRDECEVLESNICRIEYTIAKKHPLIGQKHILPECEELPPIGSKESENCVRLGIPNTVQVSHGMSKSFIILDAYPLLFQ